MAALNSGKRAPDTDHQRRRHLPVRQPHLPQPRRPRPGPGGHGAQSIVKSSNVYYYSLANEMGVDLMHDQLEPFGFGRKTGIDIEGEVTGVLPSTEWKRKRFYKKPEQQKWYAGETISLGIGQGYNNFTMLQTGHRHGHAGLRRPALQAAPGARDRGRGHARAQAASPATRCAPLAFKPEHVELIRVRMHGVTQEGTSVRVVRRRALQERRQDRHGAGRRHQGRTRSTTPSKIDEHQRDHSLYIAFAPVEAPTDRAGGDRRERRLRLGGGRADRAPRVRLPAARAGTRARRTWRCHAQGKSGAPIGKPRRAADGAAAGHGRCRPRRCRCRRRPSWPARRRW